MEDSSDQNKLFVGGISWETTEEILKQHFRKYGNVVASPIAKDRFTGSSRGFAFVTFSDSYAVDLALQDSHEIRGRTVEVKKAIPRSEQNPSKQQSMGLGRNSRSRTDQQFRTKKIFVGGLSANLTEEEFKNYFEKFGRITDVVVMHDSVTHRPRGFGFITFASEDAVEEVVANNFHQLNDKLVEVKRAIPKEGNNGMNGNNGGMNGNNGSGNVHNVHNARADGRGSNYIGIFPPSNPRYGFLPGYGSFPGYGGYSYPPGLYAGSYPYGYYGVLPMEGSPWFG